ncbi:MAG: TRAP transporter substrate-binding protein [Desulfosarcina sp.]|nr:TRAP transporter substrate-binding protein [Desulfobacterales bacterium]
MKNNNSFYLRLFLVLILSVIFLASSTPCQAAKKQIIVRMVGTLPVHHHLTKALEMFRDIVEKRSENRVKFQLYPAQQLYNDKDLVNVLPKGAIDGAIINSALWSGKVRAEGPLFFPMYFESREQFYKLFTTEAWDLIKKDFEEEGNVKVLGLVEYGSASLISKRPVEKLEDFKGLRTRAYGMYLAVFLQSVGASPVVMSSGDVYLSLQRNTIDAALSGPSTFVDRKWYEVAKYFLGIEVTHSTPFLTVFNLDFWKKLPPDLQNIFQDAALEVQEWTQTYTLTSDQNYRKTLREKGLTEIPIDEKEMARWREKAVVALVSAYKEHLGAEKAQTILDALPK